MPVLFLIVVPLATIVSLYGHGLEEQAVQSRFRQRSCWERLRVRPERTLAEASREFQAALALDPRLLQVRYQLAICLFALGDDERAYEVAGRAHGLNPQDADTAALLFKVRVLLAQRSFERKEYSLCLRRLLEASELRPGEAEIHRRLAEVYRLLGQSNQAERETQEARRLGGIGLQ